MAQRTMQGSSGNTGRRLEVRLRRLLNTSWKGCQCSCRPSFSRNCVTMVKRERGAAAPGKLLPCQYQEARKSFKARNLCGLNGISKRLIWQPCTGDIKGSKTLEARKLVRRPLPKQSSGNRARDKCEHYPRAGRTDRPWGPTLSRLWSMRV